jgi:16S rRNA (guanine527-N7)-methyltransferase
MRRYADLLSTTAAEWGLIGPREVPRIWDRHILNCLVVAPLIPDSVSVADVGSGAGLPGLVLAIARPDLHVTLVEPLLRRVTWLTQTVDALELSNVTLLRGRADAVDERFAVVTARAVANLSQLLEWCLPLVAPHGTFLALKGATAADELDAAQPILRSSGASSWTLESVGGPVVDPPTTVVRVEAGASAPRLHVKHAKPVKAKRRR